MKNHLDEDLDYFWLQQRTLYLCLSIYDHPFTENCPAAPDCEPIFLQGQSQSRMAHPPTTSIKQKRIPINLLRSRQRIQQKTPQMPPPPLPLQHRKPPIPIQLLIELLPIKSLRQTSSQLPICSRILFRVLAIELQYFGPDFG